MVIGTSVFRTQGRQPVITRFKHVSHDENIRDTLNT